MKELNYKRLILAMVHGMRSMRTPQGLQAGFSQAVQIFVQIEPLLNELKEGKMVEVADDATIVILEAGYAELHKIDFDALFDAVQEESRDVESLQGLLEKVKKTPLPDAGLDVSSFEWTGTIRNTTPRKISEFLFDTFGGTSKIQMIEDQVVYNDSAWDLMAYGLVNSAIDDSIKPGHDDYRIKAVYMGPFKKLDSFVKGFVRALDRESLAYDFEYYEIDEEEDIVGEEFRLFSEGG